MKGSIKTPPPCMPDQVLCKKATVERMRAQQARWLAQREEALRRQDKTGEPENRASQHTDGNELAARPSPAGHSQHVEEVVMGMEMTTHLPAAGYGGRGDLDTFDHAQYVQYPAIEKALEAHARRAGARSSRTEGYVSAYPDYSCKALAAVARRDAEEDEVLQEEFAEMDQMQDWMAAMEFQMQEIDF